MAIVSCSLSCNGQITMSYVVLVSAAIFALGGLFLFGYAIYRAVKKPNKQKENVLLTLKWVVIVTTIVNSNNTSTKLNEIQDKNMPDKESNSSYSDKLDKAVQLYKTINHYHSILLLS